MQYNKLGDSGLLVSELSFGAWVTFQVRSALALAHAHATSAVGPARWRLLPLPLLADPWRCCLQHEGQVSQVEACLEIMKAAYDGGVNFFDNAEGARCMCLEPAAHTPTRQRAADRTAPGAAQRLLLSTHSCQQLSTNIQHCHMAALDLLHTCHQAMAPVTRRS
jgi:hypothetical protein